VSYVGADKVSEDSWRWRKYGQKPIKGSSYPRFLCIQNSNVHIFFLLILKQ